MALEKATITNTITNDVVTVNFNPQQYALSRSNVFAEVGIPGLESPIIQFCRGNARVLTMDLFFDTYEANSDVRELIDPVTALMAIDPETHAPPVCLFSWGNLLFECIIESINKKFDMFFSSGIPARATLSVTFKEYKPPEQQALEAPEETGAVTRTHTVKQGDTLWAIAGKEYGKPTLWPKIADANGIDDPKKLQIGTVLTIPPLDS